MIPVQFKVDIFTELSRLGYDEFIVPQAVVEELRILVKRYKGDHKVAANVALSLCDRCTIINAKGIADDIIVQLAEDTDAAVLTNDTGLRSRLYQKHISVIQLRQKNRLEITV